MIATPVSTSRTSVSPSVAATSPASLALEPPISHRLRLRVTCQRALRLHMSSPTQAIALPARATSDMSAVRVVVAEGRGDSVLVLE